MPDKKHRIARFVTHPAIAGTVGALAGAANVSAHEHTGLLFSPLGLGLGAAGLAALARRAGRAQVHTKKAQHILEKLSSMGSSIGEIGKDVAFHLKHMPKSLAIAGTAGATLLVAPHKGPLAPVKHHEKHAVSPEWAATKMHNFLNTTANTAKEISKRTEGFRKNQLLDKSMSWNIRYNIHLDQLHNVGKS